MRRIENIPLSKIRLDGGTQQRDVLDQDVIREYATAIVEETVMPPIEVVCDNSDYWLWDGFYRWYAHKMSGRDIITCSIRDGSKADAIWLSCGANKSHGIRRNAKDIVKAISTAIELNPTATTREIAVHVGVSHMTVWRCLKKQEPPDADPVAMLQPPPDEPIPPGALSDMPTNAPPPEYPMSPPIPNKAKLGEPERPASASAMPPLDQEDDAGKPVPEELKVIFEARGEFYRIAGAAKVVAMGLLQLSLKPEGKYITSDTLTTASDLVETIRAGCPSLLNEESDCGWSPRGVGGV